VKILVVDDEKDIVENIGAFLLKKGYAVDKSYDGSEAWESISRNGYDLVFLDFNLPGLTGLEIIKLIKENHLPAKTVMVTAYQDMKEFFAKRVGADEYLNKPYKLEDIEKIVTKYAVGNNGHEKRA
jgi:Response regulator containing CheY-like receiver, AAA-type ATPase, and DNA-binding domains